MVSTLVIKNRIRAFVKQKGITVYRLIQDTGISNTTGYLLANNPEQMPSRETLDAICRVYKCQPGDLLEYVD